jgi:hypothetical protein
MAKPGGIAYIRMHADVEVFPLGIELPEGFEEDPVQYRNRHISTDQFIDAMLEHKMFQNPVNFPHADAIRAAIEMRKNEKLDYYGAPRAALSALSSAINAPMFSIVTGGQPSFEPIYPWVPRVCQLLRPMMAMCKTVLSSKPEVQKEEKAQGGEEKEAEEKPNLS